MVFNFEQFTESYFIPVCVGDETNVVLGIARNQIFDSAEESNKFIDDNVHASIRKYHKTITLKEYIRLTNPASSYEDENGSSLGSW